MIWEKYLKNVGQIDFENISYEDIDDFIKVYESIRLLIGMSFLAANTREKILWNNVLDKIETILKRLKKQKNIYLSQNNSKTVNNIKNISEKSK